jgi:hypothetical protein
MSTNYGQPTGTPVTSAQVEEVVPVLQPGIYPARFGAIAQQQNDNGTFWLWTFIARDGGNDVEITATTSPRITPRTKAAKWLSAFGVNVGVGETVQFADLLDMPCQILVVINEAGYSRIEAVLPYPTSK